MSSLRMLAMYGKGGIGKSTVVTTLSTLFAKAGKRVLQFGCDPKADSCYSLVSGSVRTVMDMWVEHGEDGVRMEHFLMHGRHGIDCIEVGGPTPGSGCGGRGITKAFELIGGPEQLQTRYDIVLFDVLGDVVCGGFSAPMHASYADEIYIVTSGEPRALFAANNISQAVKKFGRGGVRLGGLIGNLRGLKNERAEVERLASLINTQVVHFIPRDNTVSVAERKRLPIVDLDPQCPASKEFVVLYERVANMTPEQLKIPRPLLREEFDKEFWPSE